MSDLQSRIALSVTPRVNGSNLKNYVGQQVLLMGKVASASAGRMDILSSDRTIVPVVFDPNYEAFQDGPIEVVGTANEDGTISAIMYYVVMDFDLDAYNQLLSLIPSYPNLF